MALHPESVCFTLIEKHGKKSQKTKGQVSVGLLVLNKK